MRSGLCTTTMEVKRRCVMATIVVGIDGSQPSRNALRWSVEEAKLRERRS